MSGMAALQEKLVQAKRVMDKIDGSPSNNTQRDNSNHSPNLPPISNNFNTNSIDNVIRSNDGMNKPTVTEEKVKNSNLPDAIKKLMIDHPIPDATFGNQLPDSLLEGAAEKMKQLGNLPNNATPNPPKNNSNIVSNTKTQKLTQSSLKNLIRETIKDSLNDLIKESISERIIESRGVDENVQIVVGSTVFNGKITSTKKIS